MLALGGHAMYRLSSSFLLLALACAAPAAPAPLNRAWLSGWDRPVDPVGDCRFDRAGAALTVTVPGRGHGLEVLPIRLKAPRLLRDVQGDFAVQVRVGGLRVPAENADRGAGIILAGGKGFVRFQRTAEKIGGEAAPTLCIAYPENGDNMRVYADGPPLRGAAYLRVERRGGDLRFYSSRDGKEWAEAFHGEAGRPMRYKLPHRLKVGVVAEATAEGTFGAVFDRFKLTNLR
jgi:hypothetical protein